MPVVPYPDYDYRVSSNRDRWHPCVKGHVDQCKDHHSQVDAHCEKWSTPEGNRETLKRKAWYDRQRP